jgi:acid phosphatase (class A)
MSLKFVTANLIVLFASTGLFYGQTESALPSKTEVSSKTAIVTYVDPSTLHLDLILPPAPARESNITTSELGDLHHIEAVRTSAQVTQARADDREQDIFIFRTVLGEGFNAESFPLAASLSIRVFKEESAASSLLKKFYHRSRPYQADSTLHPVCPLNSEPTSYPSGHALSGYLLAYTLVQIVPEKKKEIFERTDQYAHNRLICGVHYASDIEASRSAAYVIFGALAASPSFQQDLAAAREETRRKLDLPAAVQQ